MPARMTYREFIVHGQFLTGGFSKGATADERKREMAKRMRTAAAAWREYKGKSCVAKSKPGAAMCSKKPRAKKSRAKKSRAKKQ